MELTLSDIGSIGYSRRDKELTKKLMPWVWAMLVVLLACILVFAALIPLSTPSTTYITPDGDEVVITLGYATFNGWVMEKGSEPSVSPIIYVLMCVFGTIVCLSILSLGGLMVYISRQTQKARHEFIVEWLKDKGITDLS